MEAARRDAASFLSRTGVDDHPGRRRVHDGAHSGPSETGKEATMTERDGQIPTGETGSNFGEVDPGTTGSDVEHLLANAEVGAPGGDAGETGTAGAGGEDAGAVEGASDGGLGYGVASGGADITGGTGAGDNPNDVDAGPESDLDPSIGRVSGGHDPGSRS